MVGFAQLVTDGEIQAYLCNLAVDARFRRRAIGRRLVQEAFQRSGATRVDLLAIGDSARFYRAFDHRELQGYRIYPDTPGV